MGRLFPAGELMSGVTADLLIWFAAGTGTGLFIAMLAFATLVIVERRALRRRLRLARSARAMRERDAAPTRYVAAVDGPDALEPGIPPDPPEESPAVVRQGRSALATGTSASFVGTILQPTSAPVRVSASASVRMDERLLARLPVDTVADPAPDLAIRPVAEPEAEPAAELDPPELPAIVAPQEIAEPPPLPMPTPRSSAIVDPEIAAAAARRRAAKAAREEAAAKAARDAELAIALKEAAAASDREGMGGDVGEPRSGRRPFRAEE